MNKSQSLIDYTWRTEMRTGYIRFNGVDKSKIERESKCLRDAGCEDIIVEHITRSQDAPKLDAYLTQVQESDELIVCSSASLSRRMDVLVNAAETLKAVNAELTILDKSLDPTNPNQLQLLKIMAARRELESLLYPQE